ncbi:MAG: hypothetical protein Q8Q07_04040 [Dehalococcoidales bacterium]|nr:hypothetical protein [Dehalococcoidales bacterium]
MASIITIAVLAALAFLVWFVYRAVKNRQVKAHNIAFGISVLTGIFSYAFFLGMDIPQPLKILVSIFVGIGLIFFAAYLQRRRQPDKP